MNEMIAARDQLVDEGFCIVDGRLPAGKLETLRSWSTEWLGRVKHSKRWKYQGSDLKLSGIRTPDLMNSGLPTDPLVDFLIEHPEPILADLGMADFSSIGLFQIIAKPAHSPALYWHQDWMKWNDPMSLSPWPQRVFLNWYLTDTYCENGCLRVIPGSHRRRIDLHEHLVAPHEGGGYFVEESNEWMFFDHPDAVDVPIEAGQLLIADARLLHATYPNNSDELRTLLLGWYFRHETEQPAWWQGEVPQEILDRDSSFDAPRSRVPGIYLR